MSNLLTCANTLNSIPHMDYIFHNGNSKINNDAIGSSWLPQIKPNKSSDSIFGLSQQCTNEPESFDYVSSDDEKLFESFFPFLEDFDDNPKKVDSASSLTSAFGANTTSTFVNSNVISSVTVSTSLCSNLSGSLMAIDHLSLEKEMLDQNAKIIPNTIISNVSVTNVNSSPVFVSELPLKNSTKLDNIHAKEFVPLNVASVVDRFKMPLVSASQEVDKFAAWNPFGSQNIVGIQPLNKVSMIDNSVKAIGSEMSKAKKMGLFKNGISQIQNYQDHSPTELRNTAIVQPILNQSNSVQNVDQELINSLSKLILASSSLNGSSFLSSSATEVVTPNSQMSINSIKLACPVMKIGAPNAQLIDTAIPQDLIDFLKFFTVSGLIPEHLLKPKNMNPAVMATLR